MERIRAKEEISCVYACQNRIWPKTNDTHSPSSLSESGVLRRRDEPLDGSRGDSGVRCRRSSTCEERLSRSSCLWSRYRSPSLLDLSRLVLAFHLFFGDRGHGPVVGCNLVDSDRLRYTGPAHHGIFQRYGDPSNLWAENRET